MTAERLARLQNAAERAYTRMVIANDRRRDAVREAISEGWTHAQIAEATGLTRGRIGQLAKPATKTADFYGV